jgi:predicted nucleic acid-binding protein
VPTVTSVKVVDASALAALLFGEPEGESVASRLAGGRLVAPFLLGFELTNACLKKIRRHPSQREALQTAFRLRGRLGVEELGTDYDAVLELAAETGLTAYDACYLWLAHRLGAELVTLDRQLAKAAAGS